MFNKKMEKSFNEQINEELYSAYLYLSMVAYFESTNLPGFANWMRVQTQEEIVHAMKFYDYINQRDGRVILTALADPQIEWKSPMDAFEAAYKHELHITAKINELVNQAIEEKDHAANMFLQWFVNEQIEEVEKVKRFEAGFVFNPVVLSPQNTIKDVYDVNDKYGFFSVPITEDGTLNSKLVGIVTNRDVRYRKDMETKLKEVMTPRERLIVADKSETADKNDLKEANEIIRKNNLDTLPIIDEEDRIVALVTDSDLRKNENYPLATKDENKQLRTFIAIEGRLKLAKERIGKAFDADADGINIEASVVFKEQLEIAKYCKENFPTLDVIMGNVASAEVVRKIIEQGFDYCDAIKIGMGPGAACITQQELGTGRAQASAEIGRASCRERV
jgi:ferritin